MYVYKDTYALQRSARPTAQNLAKVTHGLQEREKTFIDRQLSFSGGICYAYIDQGCSHTGRCWAGPPGTNSKRPALTIIL